MKSRHLIFSESIIAFWFMVLYAKTAAKKKPSQHIVYHHPSGWAERCWIVKTNWVLSGNIYRLNNSPHMIKISLSATLCSAALSKRLQKPPRPLFLFWVSPIIRSQKRHIKSSCRKLMTLCRLLCFTLWWSDWLSRVWAEWLQALQLQFFTYLQRPIISHLKILDVNCNCQGGDSLFAAENIVL